MQSYLEESDEERLLEEMRLCNHLFVRFPSRMRDGFEDTRFPNLYCVKCGIKNYLADYRENSDLSRIELKKQEVFINTLGKGITLDAEILILNLPLASSIYESIAELYPYLPDEDIKLFLEEALKTCEADKKLNSTCGSYVLK